MSSSDYYDELDINLFQLHEEWRKQPQLYAKYANRCTKARKKHFKIWEKKKTRKAALIKEYREENKSAKNDEVESYWRTDKEYKRLALKVIDLEYEYNMLNNAVFSFTQRKAALENEVKLFLGEYYSDPKPGDGESHKFVKDLKQTEVKDKIKRSLKSSRRRRRK